MVELKNAEEKALQAEKKRQEALAAAAAAVTTSIPPSLVPPICSVQTTGLSKAARRKLRAKKASAWNAALDPKLVRERKEKERKLAALADSTPCREEDKTGSRLDRGRLPKTWNANKVSCKLIMFHVLFLRMFRLKAKKKDKHDHRNDSTHDTKDDDEETELV